MITSDIAEFVVELMNNPGNIVGYMPTNTKYHSNALEKVSDAFSDENIGIVYTDIRLNIENKMYLHGYKSYAPDSFASNQTILSPIFVRCNEPIKIEYTLEFLFSHITLKALESSLFPKHIPEVLFEINVSPEEEDKIKRDIERIEKNEPVCNYSIG